jgi:hypothetical protein
MVKLPDTTKLSAKEQKALDELLAKAGTSIAALASNGKSPMSDPAYRQKCIALRPTLEQTCIEHGVTLAHVFTASNKPAKQYRDPASGAVYSKGKKPSWLKGHEAEYLVRSN